MKVLRYFVGVLALLLSFSAGRAQMIPDNVGQSSNGLPPALVNVGFDPQLNAQIPLDAAFTDEMGNSARLRDYSGRSPSCSSLSITTVPCSAVRWNKQLSDR